ncbi:MAG TPA: sulfotransferase domain-containing protein [Conexibacter sp.]|nr:sulfotransferase domain-containing protein [Conexibacter sp.]
MARAGNADCEVHIPISPTAGFLSQIHLLAASLRRSGGRLDDARIVVTVSRDTEPFDLDARCPWARRYGIEWRWMEPELFARTGIFGTALRRFTHDFDAPFVLMLDADTLCLGPLDELLSLGEHALAGFVAHLSPAAPDTDPVRFWNELHTSAGLAPPALSYRHSGSPFLDADPARAPCPPYFNLGVLAGSRDVMTTLGSVLFDEMAGVQRRLDTVFRCQLAVTLALARTGTPSHALAPRWNFPNDERFARAYPDDAADVRILHYLREDQIDRGSIAAGPERLDAFLARRDLTPVNRLLQRQIGALRGELAAADYSSPAMSASPASARTVCVLGFHRSGTSMVARALNMLGVDLGPEDELLKPEEHDNPRGYWEPRWVIETNDAILEHFGGAWWTTFPPAPGWERDAALEPLRVDARRHFEESFGAATLRGWKDPRTSLTLPFWQHVAPMSDALYLVCMRNPIDAIASLQRRPQPDLSTSAWAAVWLEYIARALMSTAGRRRLLVFYEDFFSDGRAEIDRLARFLGRPLDENDARLEQTLASIESDLRHHTTSPRELAAIEGLPAAVRAAFLALRAARDLGDDERGIDDVAQALERIVPDVWWAHVLAEQRGEQVAAAERQLATTLEQLGQATAELEASAARSQATSEQIGGLERDLQCAHTAIADVTSSLSWRLTAPLRAAKGRLRSR